LFDMAYVEDSSQRHEPAVFILRTRHGGDNPTSKTADCRIVSLYPGSYYRCRYE
jgi:hypothetical protein